MGAWHGDLGPWNAACGSGGLELWDWERYEPDVPAALDAAHWRAQVAVGEPPPSASWTAMCRDVGEVLDVVAAQPAHPVAPVDEDDSSVRAAVVAACYLLAIWRRYRHDAGGAASPALRTRVAWLCEVAAAATTTLEGTSA